MCVLQSTSQRSLARHSAHHKQSPPGEARASIRSGRASSQWHSEAIETRSGRHVGFRSLLTTWVWQQGDPGPLRGKEVLTGLQRRQAGQSWTPHP